MFIDTGKWNRSSGRKAALGGVHRFAYGRGAHRHARARTPHPAPAAAAQLLGADLGRAILYGTALSVPMAIAGGILYGGWIARRMYIRVPDMAPKLLEIPSDASAPPVPLVIALLLLPVGLILIATLAGPGNPPLQFLGHPFTALTVTLLGCMIFFGWAQGKAGELRVAHTRAESANRAPALIGPRQQHMPSSVRFHPPLWASPMGH
jgi:H+/gluconate symporter-like permease